jgi:hypothetical protein
MSHNEIERAVDKLVGAKRVVREQDQPPPTSPEEEPTLSIAGRRLIDEWEPDIEDLLEQIIDDWFSSNAIAYTQDMLNCDPGQGIDPEAFLHAALKKLSTLLHEQARLSR